MLTLHFKTRATARNASATITEKLKAAGINNAQMKPAREKDRGLWDAKLVFSGGTLKLSK